MTDHDDRPTYAYYPAFRAHPDLRGKDSLGITHEAEQLLKEWDERVHVRGVYSTVAFRTDADFMMWWVARSPDDVQELLAEFRRTPLGRGLDQTHAFLGVHRPPEVAKDHVPAFMKGDPPKRYLNNYGQFLEHMFEGIKFGLHAELLRNRSFEEPANAIGLSRYWERYPDDRNDDYAISFGWDGMRFWPGWGQTQCRHLIDVRGRQESTSHTLMATEW